ELPERDDRPAPEEDAADRAQSEREQREDAGRGRDVAEGRGERAEEPERTPQFLPVTEAGELVLVARRFGRGLVVDVHAVLLRVRGSRYLTHDRKFVSTVVSARRAGRVRREAQC